MSEKESQGDEGGIAEPDQGLSTSPTSPTPSSSPHSVVAHSSSTLKLHSPSPPPSSQHTAPLPSSHHINASPHECTESAKASISTSSTSSFGSERLMDEPLAEAVVEQLKDVVERLSLGPPEKRSLEERVGLTGEAVRKALVFVASRSRELDRLEEELETKELMLEMRELVVAAEVERQTRRLEELSEGLLDKMNALQNLHDALTPSLARKFKDTVEALKDAAEGEEEARVLCDLLDRQEGTETPSESSWPEPHSVQGEQSRGAHFRVGREEVFVHAQSGEVWVKLRPNNLDICDPEEATDLPSLPNDDVTPSDQSDTCDL